MSMDLFGEVAGRIGMGGGGGEVADVKVKTSSQYESVVDENDKTAYIDLSDYAKESELSEYVTSDGLTLILANYVTSTSLSSILNDYVTDSELSTALSYYVTQSELSTELTSYQPKLTAGENITIENNVISASGGGGGGLDLPTDGTPVAIGTFGNKTIYMKYVNVNVHTGATNFDVWTGQSGDYVLGYNLHIHSPSNQGVVIGIPNNDSYCDTSFVTNINTVIPTIKLYINIKQGFLSDVMCVGYVIFTR